MRAERDSCCGELLRSGGEIHNRANNPDAIYKALICGILELNTDERKEFLQMWKAESLLK